MNINLDRYYDAVTISEKPFFKKWHRLNFKLAYKICNKKDNWLDWSDKHKIIMWFANIPMRIDSWLCCGFKYIKDESIKGGRTWNDNYHMLSKLCRYETWESVKITWWDKVRFRLITGYKFE